jgi:hypothetical protein
MELGASACFPTAITTSLHQAETYMTSNSCRHATHGALKTQNVLTQQ